MLTEVVLSFDAYILCPPCGGSLRNAILCFLLFSARSSVRLAIRVLLGAAFSTKCCPLRPLWATFAAFSFALLIIFTLQI